MTEPTTPSAGTGNDHDLALLRAVMAADRQAFDELYRAYYPRLRRFLMRMTHRYDVVDEVIDDTFWTIWQKAAAFRGESRPSTWIFGIAYRIAIKALRKPAGASSAAPVIEIRADCHDDRLDDSLEETLLADERKNWLDRGLLHLSTEHRTTVVLAYYLGHSCEEIAAIMACPVGTVKARMFHARVRLRNILTSPEPGATHGGRRAQRE